MKKAYECVGRLSPYFRVDFYSDHRPVAQQHWRYVAMNRVTEAAVLVTACFSLEMCAAKIIYVDQSAQGEANGTSWSNAFPKLEVALATANPSDEIRIAEGIYVPGIQRSDSFVIDTLLSLYGGFPAGGGDGTMEARNPESHPTVLSGDLLQDDQPGLLNRTDNAYHVVVVDDPFLPGGQFHLVTLDGLTVTAGHADSGDGTGNDQAGGVYSSELLTLRNVTIRDNFALSVAGGVLLHAGSSWAIHCTFSGNRTNGGGGGIFLETAATLSVNDCRFEGNVSGLGSAGSSESKKGSALYANGASVLHLDRSVFQDNRALGISLHGALALVDNEAVVRNCIFKGNYSDFGPAAVRVEDGSPSFVNCSFEGNRQRTPVVVGGFSPLPRFINCRWQGNVGGSMGVGAFQQGSGSSTLINCSMQGNVGEGSGAIMVSGGSISLVNCIIWGNSYRGDTDVPRASIYVGSGVTASYSHSLFHNIDLTSLDPSSLDGSNPANDPHFVLEIDPGLAPATGGDLRLLSTSPALNAGDNAANTETTDIAGAARIQDGVIDLGAYEGAFVTFAHLYPGLAKEEDKNANGISNYGDYATGANPLAATNPSGSVIFIRNKLTFPFRNNAADVYPVFQKSKDLSTWVGMTQGIDYTISGSVQNEDQTLLTVEIHFDPTESPRIFFREQFSDTPP